MAVPRPPVWPLLGSGRLPARTTRGERFVVPRRLAALAAALLVALVAACERAGPLEDGGPEARGDLIRSERLRAYSRAQAEQAIAQLQVGEAFRARFDVELHGIVYRTVDPEGQPVTATGAVYLPVDAPAAVPLTVYLHGTQTQKSDVPSNPSNIEGFFVGLLTASHGDAVVLPDYLGLGGGAAAFPFHPYLHAATQASAGLDALRAARVLAARTGTSLDGRLFLTGYSQGGHAAMALHRELDSVGSAEFEVTAAAPMSGPYDLYGTARVFVGDDTENPPVSAYGVYLAAAYQRLYGVADRLDEVVRPPYDEVAETLLRDGMPFTQLMNALSPVPRQNLQPELVSAVLEDPNSPMSAALQENDVYDWAPRAPVRLYFGSADRDVPPENALTAAARMRQLGADVEAVDLGPFDHVRAVMPASMAVRLWFDTFRE